MPEDSLAGLMLSSLLVRDSVSIMQASLLLASEGVSRGECVAEERSIPVMTPCFELRSGEERPRAGEVLDARENDLTRTSGEDLPAVECEMLGDSAEVGRRSSRGVVSSERLLRCTNPHGESAKRERRGGEIRGGERQEGEGGGGERRESEQRGGESIERGGRGSRGG